MLGFYQEMFDVIPLDDEVVAAEYGYLRASRGSVGQPVADNDLWIAACATRMGFPWPRSTGGTSSRSRSSACRCCSHRLVTSPLRRNVQGWQQNTATGRLTCEQMLDAVFLHARQVLTGACEIRYSADPRTGRPHVPAVADGASFAVVSLLRVGLA
jgi:hypothetical protein